ncbi:DUF4136 domain-containing protein [Alginatibacterium sediminis]|uniref:DUF4136 domain-containing protein n=1 Tax=Alginatibacterium sediminis TaxID=2164068 RepID=A0A420E8P3_9ALTE|nr:DUF4136 domain-containing protein [Alginatibacterium sediminis]RKF15859.1 DUF4136 domain-containing protein [Alginatibacterium sediminis]
MKASVTLVIVAAMLSLLTACSSPVNSPDPAARIAVSSGWLYPALYPSGSSFALLRVYPENSSLPANVALEAYQRYGKVIERNLLANGYIQSSPETADFLVRYGLALDADVSDAQMLAKFGISSGLQSLEQLQKASLLIYMLDPLSERLDYRSVAQGFMQDEGSSDEELEFEQRVVSSMLTQFYQE